MADKQIGKVSHYYDKINVAVIDLTGNLSVGDNIKLEKGETEFTQTVDSIQVDHKSVNKAKKGDSVGIKVDQPIKPPAAVYLTA